MPSLFEVWKSEPDFFEGKSVQQVISMCVDGELRDNSESSVQFRELLSNLPTKKIEQYVEGCLTASFKQSGFALQDLTNEIGRRLGFEIRSGLYRGVRGKNGFDGVWAAKDQYKLVVEVKTTDAYLIDLDVQAKYRQGLIEDGVIDENHSSILLVVGRNDTGGLEAQTRGSKHAWDIRIVSVDALIKMMMVKENVSEPATLNQIQKILRPREFTRVDLLVDLIFDTSEDIQADDFCAQGEPVQNGVDMPQTGTIPVKFHDRCIERVSKHLNIPLLKDGRCKYANASKNVRVLCIVSKEYEAGSSLRYWYSFHPTQKDYLEEADEAYIAIGCGSEEQTILLPWKEFEGHLPEMRTTDTDARFYWHVELFNRDGKCLLNKSTDEGVEVTDYLLK